MPRYLDPKADVVFKKIFGQHPELLKSFLNAVLPLPTDGLIVDLEYLPSEQVPAIPLFKYTIVDVRCTDQQGQIFIVEMQVQWTNSFLQRMLFNASHAYVKQLERGEHYHLLRPVYGLGILNTQFDDNPNDWYHHYKMVNVENPKAEIKDLQLVFVELPKFQAKQYHEKKLQVLWLRFLSELDNKTTKIPTEFLQIPEIRKAVELAEEAAYSPAELASYDKYWDAISVEKTLLGEAIERGLAKGLEQGLEQGREQGREEGIVIGIEQGKIKAKVALARKLLAKKMPPEEVAGLTELSLNEIKQIS